MLVRVGALVLWCLGDWDLGCLGVWGFGSFVFVGCLDVSVLGRLGALVFWVLACICVRVRVYLRACVFA